MDCLNLEEMRKEEIYYDTIMVWVEDDESTTPDGTFNKWYWSDSKEKVKRFIVNNFVAACVRSVTMRCDSGKYEYNRDVSYLKEFCRARGVDAQNEYEPYLYRITEMNCGVEDMDYCMYMLSLFFKKIGVKKRIFIFKNPYAARAFLHSQGVDLDENDMNKQFKGEENHDGRRN